MQEGVWGDRPSLKSTKVILFIMILHNSENNIREIRSFWRSLFCHSGVVKHTSSVLQELTRSENWLPNITEIDPHLRSAPRWSRHPGCKSMIYINASLSFLSNNSCIIDFCYRNFNRSRTKAKKRCQIILS